tara:strand:+ start:8208 stop:8402 length:195 start_codon:yes stop_codon:yes gene_type:complete
MKNNKLSLCLDCKNAVIELDKLDTQVEKLQCELKNYCNENAEYQLVSNKLDRLISLRNNEQKRG